SRAGAPDRSAAVAKVAQRLLEAIAEDEPRNGRAFATGDDERIDPFEFGRLSDFGDALPHLFELLAVLAKVALERQHPNRDRTRRGASGGRDDSRSDAVGARGCFSHGTNLGR